MRHAGEKMGPYLKSRATPAAQAIEALRLELRVTFDELEDLLVEVEYPISRRTLIAVANGRVILQLHTQTRLENGIRAIWNLKRKGKQLPDRICTFLDRQK